MLRVGNVVEGATLDLSTEASPEVLRELHQAHVQQLRSQTLVRSALFLAALGASPLLGAVPGTSYWLLVGLVGVIAIQTGVEWDRARRTDGISSESRDLAELAREQERLLAFDARLAAFHPRVTTTIAVLVTLATLTEWLSATSIATTVARAGLVKPLVADGEWWRLVTATFVHAGAWHLFANMAALATFGRYFEAVASRSLLWFTYFASGIAGCLASWWVRPDVSSLGASGAVMGVVAFLAVLGFRNPDALPAKIRRRCLMVLILTGFVGALASGVVDNGGHGGGAIAGAAIAWLTVGRRGPSLEERAPGWSVLIGATSAVAIVIGAIGTMVALTTGRPFLAAIGPGPDVVVPVNSVTARLDSDGSGSFIVVRNGADRVLEAYALSVDGIPGQGHAWRDDCCIHSEGHGPIAPGTEGRIAAKESRLIWRGVRVRMLVNAAVFEDGSFEGSRNLRDRMMRRRVDAVRDADFWIQKLDVVTSVPAADVAARLDVYANARAHYSDVSTELVTAFGIYKLMTDLKTAPSAAANRIGETRAAIMTARAKLGARLKPASQPRLPDSGSSR